MHPAATHPRTEPHAGLLAQLRERSIPFELAEHRPTITARETAKAAGVELTQFAKVVVVRTESGQIAELVLDACDAVDLHRAARVMRARRLRLLTEAELAKLAPDCEVGTIPPINELHGLPIYADYAVALDPRITFHAGTHRHVVTVDRAAWERANHVTYCGLAEEAPIRPELVEWY